jgi:hypothetical protein
MSKAYKFLFIASILCTSCNAHAVETHSENKPEVTHPTFVSNNVSHKKKELKDGFENKVPQFEYFLQEITNFVDTPSSVYFYDYINPNVPEEAFSNSEFNIYKKMLLLKDVEKSSKERNAIHDISKFLATNFKTQNIPAYVYINNPQLPEPLYMSQLVSGAFKAIQIGNIDALHALIDNYDLINSKDKFGNELLTTAVMFRRNSMAKFLISKGANINAANQYGTTPIIMAAINENHEIAEFLIKQHCNLRKVDHLGNSALDYAKETKNVQMYFLLTNGLKRQRK